MWPREGGGYYVKDEEQPSVYQETHIGCHKIYLTFLGGLPGVYKRENIKMRVDKEKRTVSVVGEEKAQGKYNDVWLRFERVFAIPEECEDMEGIYLDDTCSLERLAILTINIPIKDPIRRKTEEETQKPTIMMSSSNDNKGDGEAAAAASIDDGSGSDEDKKKKKKQQPLLPALKSTDDDSSHDDNTKVVGDKRGKAEPMPPALAVGTRLMNAFVAMLVILELGVYLYHSVN